jgi:PAS domain-containing protein
MGQAAEWEGPAKASEETLEQLARTAPYGFAIVREGQLRWANAALAELAGRPDAEALVGVAFSELCSDGGQGLPERTRARAVECTLRRPVGAERRVICRLAWPSSPGTDAWWIEDVTQLRMLERDPRGQSCACTARPVRATAARQRSGRDPAVSPSYARR